MSDLFNTCIVPNALTLYAHLLHMGKRNKVVKLTEKKIRYIIRTKTTVPKTLFVT